MTQNNWTICFCNCSKAERIKPMTLDMALELFAADQNRDNAMRLQSIAREYHGDEMIGDYELANILAKTRAVLREIAKRSA